MNLIINPGSHIGQESEGWTNTYEFALKNALNWLETLKKDGFTDILMTSIAGQRDGRWTFVFTHQVTGKSVELETHGIDPMDAYLKQYIFPPRVYWDGSSSAIVELEQFAADGYKAVKTYRKVAEVKS